MFGLAELTSLIISGFIFLPVVIFLRESGYFIVSGILGVKNPRLTIGSGPRIFKLGVFDVRKYYHVYSWFSYDSLIRKNNFTYICIYAGPIIINLVLAVTINPFNIMNGHANNTISKKIYLYTTKVDRQRDSLNLGAIMD